MVVVVGPAEFHLRRERIDTNASRFRSIDTDKESILPLAQRSKSIDHGLASEHRRIDERDVAHFGDWCEYGSFGYFFVAALLNCLANGFHNVTMIIHNLAHHTLRD